MSEQYPGGWISKSPPTPNGSTAPGLWNLSQQAGYRKQGLWPTVPAAPTIGTATAGNAQASVTFTAPSDVGSAAITSYTVTSNPGGITASGASSPITVTGLSNGTAYTFTVTATNGAGTGPASAASNSVTPVNPIALVTTSTFDDSVAGTSFTINKPSSVSTGNLLVCIIAKIDNSGLPSSVPSGWTRIVPPSQAKQNLYMYYKVATGSEPSTYTWSGFPNSQPVSVMIMNWNSATNYNSTTLEGSFKGGTPPTPSLGPLTAPANDSALVFAIANEDPGEAWNAPSGFTTLTPIGTSHKSSLFVWYKLNVPAGSTGVVSTTPTSSNTGEIDAQMILLAP